MRRLGDALQAVLGWWRAGIACAFTANTGPLLVW